tara:strand:- start:5 stop:508 length:504 start_codon:yes stop_codon:yes gene_type:complete
MNIENFNKKVLIIEENNKDRKILTEGYKYDKDKKRMTFDIKTDVNGKIRETSGVLTNKDIENMFSRIPRYNGFQLPRRMINDFLIGHDSKDTDIGKQKYDMTNGDIVDILDNMEKIHLNPSPGSKKKTKKYNKNKNKKKTPPRRIRSVNKKKKKKRRSARLPRISNE